MTGTRGEISGGPEYPRDALDFFIDPPWVSELLFQQEEFTGITWDPACGSGNIVKSGRARGMHMVGTDIANRSQERVIDFLTTSPGDAFWDNIICNPPFYAAQSFAEHALTIARKKVALLVQAKFLFSQTRYRLFFLHPPARLYFLSTRPSMPPGEALLAGLIKAAGGKLDYLWVVWDHEHAGETTEAKWLLRT